MGARGQGSCENLTVPTREQYHQWLTDDVLTIAALIETGDLDAPVPACPGWTFRDLIWHLGAVHRWAREVLITGTPGDRDESGPNEAAELRDWFQTGAAELLARLTSLDAATPTWTFGPPPRTVGFWDRRQAQETAVHRWDAQASQGIAGWIDPELAGDGIDEVATVFFAREVKRGRAEPLAAGVAFEPSDLIGARYVIAGNGADPAAAVTTRVRGPAEALLLALWKRRDYSDLQIEGNSVAVAALFDSVITS